MNSVTNFKEMIQIDREGALSWSGAMVQRRRAVARTDSDTTFGAADCQRPPPPPPPPPPEPVLSKKCSSCSCQGSRRLRAGAEESGLKQIGAKVYNVELEEVMNIGRVEETRERFRHAIKVLEAQELFSQSLDLKGRALARLAQLTGDFACEELPPPSSALGGILDEIRRDVGGLSERLAEVADAAGAAVETPDRLYQLLDDFRDNKKDFKATTNTLNQYLRSTNRATAGQLRKLEVNYDSIREIYDQSRQLLEKELSKLIEERHAVVERCFSKLSPLQESMVEQDKQFLALSKEVAHGLQEPKKQARKCS